MASNGYGKTIATATTAGSTAIGKDVVITTLINSDPTNFVTVSFLSAIVGSGEEFIIPKASSISFSDLVSSGVRTGTLYHKSDTATVNLTVVGKRA